MTNKLTTPAGCSDNCMIRKSVFGLLVGAQVAIAGGMIILLESAFQFWWTAIIATSAIALGVWAIIAMGRKTINISPALRPTATLIRRGPYRFVRHPMYTALAAFCGAIVMSDRTPYALALWVSLVIVLVVKSAYEEQMLKRRFPEYTQYAKSVKRYIPFIV